MSPALLLLAVVVFIPTNGFNRTPNGTGLKVLVLVGIGGFAVLVAAGLTAAT